MDVRNLSATPVKPKGVGTYLSAKDVLRDNEVRALTREPKYMMSQKQAQHVPYTCDIKL